MWKRITLVILVGSLLASCGAAPAPQGAPTTSIAPVSNALNPFGVLVGAGSTLQIDQRIKVGKDLGAVYWRISQPIIVDQWDGTCAECVAAKQAGFKLIVTIRANTAGPGAATAPPPDIKAFQAALSNILDVTKPDLLVVENKENSSVNYSGSPEDYYNELEAACSIAHQKNVKCTNGGLLSGIVLVMLWANIADQGKPAEACRFAERAWIGNEKTLGCTAKSTSDLPPATQAVLRKTKALVNVYAKARRAKLLDYMNFQWYAPNPELLREVVTYLSGRTLAPVISTEAGQGSEFDKPERVGPLLQIAFDLRMPIVVWNSDNTPTASTLMDPASGALLPTGQAFQQFINAHFLN